MKKVIFLIISCVIASNFSAFAMENKYSPAHEKLSTATKNLVSSHVECTKAAIDRKCEKLNKKIKRLEDSLYNLENSNEVDIERYSRTHLINKIQNYKEKIDALNSMKLSLDTINFNSL